MTWTFTNDPEVAAAVTWPVLAGDPVRLTWQLSTLSAARAGARRGAGEAEWFGWWRDGAGRVAALASRTPPYPLLVAAIPPAAADRPADVAPLPDQAATSLLAACDRLTIPVTGVQCDPASAALLAGLWCAATGGRVELGHAMRLYRLVRLVPPAAPPPGRAVPADAADLDLLTDWGQAFAAEAGVPPAPRAGIADRLAHAGWLLWRDPDGRPVAMAGRSRADAGVTRIAGVYTPPAQRRRGYAAALTSSLAARAQADAAVVLFADLANTTSTGIYRRLGFRPVADRCLLRFVPPPAPGTMP